MYSKSAVDRVSMYFVFPIEADEVLNREYSVCLPISPQRLFRWRDSNPHGLATAEPDVLQFGSQPFSVSFQIQPTKR